MTRTRSPMPKPTSPEAARAAQTRSMLQHELRAMSPKPIDRSGLDVPSGTPAAERGTPRRLGDYLQANRLISAHELDAALAEQRRRIAQGQPVALGDLLVEQGLLTTQDLVKVLMLQHLDRLQEPTTEAAPPVGELLVQAGLITAEQLAAALTIQTTARKRGETIRLGQILLASGAVTRHDLASTLAHQRRARRR